VINYKQKSETAYLKYLLTEVYPIGLFSYVADSFNFWGVVDESLPKLKDVILKREGRLIVRPDSGNPVDIICGVNYEKFNEIEDAIKAVAIDTREDAGADCEGSYNCGKEEYSREVKIGDEYYRITFEFDYNRHDKKYYYVDGQIHKSTEKFNPEAVHVGLIERLWEIFGGTINSKGYKELNPKIGAIYGDSITLEVCQEICERLQKKGFASTNIVFGIGSYTYQYNTRDTFGWAMKATYCEINGEGVPIFKNPKTDSGVKKSHKGLLKVIASSSAKYGFEVLENITWDQFKENNNELKLVFNNGENIYA
jgi:nicotinamide phosphoribosyltransferase